jgi:hypothetical protein
VPGFRPAYPTQGGTDGNHHPGPARPSPSRLRRPRRRGRHRAAGAAGVAAVPIPASADITTCGAGSFQAEVTRAGGTWTARDGGTTVYSGTNLLEAMRRAVGSLTPGRTSMQRVVVRGSGEINANQSLDLPSYTGLEVCGTITVVGTPTADNAVVRARNVTDVDVLHLTVTGSPYFGVFVRNGTKHPSRPAGPAARRDRARCSDRAQTGSNAILIENCTNVTIAARSGSLRDRDIRIAARAEFPPSSNITIQNLTVTNSAIIERPCGGGNNVFRNNTLVNSSLDVCR